MRIAEPVTGVFPNSMAYARWGDGPKILLLIPGGPGNDAPTRQNLRMIRRPLGPLFERGYSLWMVARRRGMPPGHTVEDMAADYAELIQTEFDGKVDLVVGVSYGGIIGQYLAANHPERFDHIALLGAACAVSREGSRLDYDWAAARSRGNWAQAGRLMAAAMLSDSWLRWTAPVLGTVLGFAFRSHGHDQFASDVMVEADAEVAFDARPVLPRIDIPVLLIGGDRDSYFPTDLIDETAMLIPDCTLRVYEGKGHLGACMSRRIAPDILDFIEQKQTGS